MPQAPAQGAGDEQAHSSGSGGGSLAERVAALKASKGREPFSARVHVARALYREAFARLEAGEAIDWGLFRGLDIGIRPDPISWQLLLEVLREAGLLGDAQRAARSDPATEEALGALGRSWRQMRDYYHHKDRVIAKEYASTTDYLLIKIFGLQAKPGPDGRTVADVPPDFSDELRVAWTENDFPYYWEAGIEDHTVWANRPLTPQQLEQVVAENRAGYETVHYVNPPSLMSVPAIWHAHVISQRRPGQEVSPGPGQWPAGSVGG